MEFFLSSLHSCFNAFDVLSGLGLRNTNGIASACDCAADVFLPQIRIQSNDAYKTLYAAIVNFLQRMVQRDTAQRLSLSATASSRSSRMESGERAAGP